MSPQPHAPPESAEPPPERAQLRGLRALAHPLRLRLLSLTTARAYSAAEAARELGASQANISYHLRQLHAAGLVEVVAEEEIRGGRAKRYRHDPASGERLTPLGTGAEYAALAGALGAELERRSLHRDARHSGRLTDAEVWVPTEVWHRLRDVADEFGELAHAYATPPGTPGTVPVSATLLLFRTVEETEASEGADAADGAARSDAGRRDGAAPAGPDPDAAHHTARRDTR